MKPPSNAFRRRPFSSAVTLVLFALAIASCSSSQQCSSEEPEHTESPDEPDEEPSAVAEPTAEDHRAAIDTGTDLVHDAITGADVHSTQWWDERITTAMDPSQPLPDEVKRALSDIEFDPPPESLTRDTHYWVSNEDHHYLFRDALDDHGGIFSGVGTDQNYLMAAWAEAAILIPMDFDEQIRNVHHLYEVMFLRADNPQEFIELWASGRTDEMHKALEDKYGEGERFEELKSAFDTAQQTIHWRLRTTASTYEERGIPTFLTDQEQYDFIRNLWKKNRVFPIRGDLTGDITMVDVATTLDELGLNMGVIYTSNAEQYFDFIPSFRRNIAVQPFDEDSLLLRTRPASAFGLPDGGDYHYNVHPGQNFAAWMEHSPIANSWQLLARHREATDTDGLSYIDDEPHPTDPAPELAEFPASEE